MDIMTASEDSKGSEEHYGKNLNHSRESLNHHGIIVGSYMGTKGFSGEVPDRSE